MKKIFKIITYILIPVIIIFLLYLYDLHALAVDGNKIFALRCTEVNPSLIAYKNSFLNFVDAIKNPGGYTSEQVVSFYEGYISGMREYEPKENNWIETQRTFINKLDFKLIEPWYIKEAGNYEILMYTGYRDEALTTIDLVDGRITADEYSARFTDARDRRDKYSQLYFDLFDKISTINDWRKIFGRVPVPKVCTEDVLNIPNTAGALGATPTPAPSEKPRITD